MYSTKADGINAENVFLPLRHVRQQTSAQRIPARFRRFFPPAFPYPTHTEYLHMCVCVCVCTFRISSISHHRSCRGRERAYISFNNKTRYISSRNRLLRSMRVYIRTHCSVHTKHRRAVTLLLFHPEISTRKERRTCILYAYSERAYTPSRTPATL